MRNWAHDKALWKFGVFGPKLLDTILDETYNIEFPRSVVDIISGFCVVEYRFHENIELRYAVEMWEEHKAVALAKYGHIKNWDVQFFPYSMEAVLT